MKKLIFVFITALSFSCASEKTSDSGENEVSIPEVDTIIQDGPNTDSLSEEVANIPTDFPCDYDFLDVLTNEFNQSAAVLPIGVFDSTWVVGEESVFGYNVKLWRIENTLIGFLNHYYGSPEPYRSGPIVRGNISEDNEVWFTAHLKLSKGYSDWSKSDPVILNFNGTLSTENLSGTLANFNCVSKKSDMDMARSINLLASDMWGPLEKYKNIQAWKEFYAYELNMNP